jgi:pyruvate kinase
MPKTKIIATLGPASTSETVLRNMIFAGLDVARLNFSHANAATHQRRLDMVKKINLKYRRRVRILQDLEGNRIRIGNLKDGKPVELKKRNTIWLLKKEMQGSAQEVCMDYDGSFLDIKAGSDIFIDDGNVRLKASKVFKDKLLAEVVVGGLLKEHKGVNIPQADLKFPRITEKDKADIAFGIKNKVDYIALSFVRDEYDCLAARKIFKDKIPQCLLTAKIESRQALMHINEIIEASDVILIARGDMGISVPIWEIPVIQKDIIKKCNHKKKPVITATQMLERMTDNPQPSRAEVTDVANSIFDGTDFVMLSAETAVGKYPVESVRMMNQIIKYAEKSQYYK